MDPQNDPPEASLKLVHGFALDFLEGLDRHRAATMPTPTQTNCRIHTPAARVGTSVWPAEYRVRSPNAISAALASRS